jgi:hypothetical protein
MAGSVGKIYNLIHYVVVHIVDCSYRLIPSMTGCVSTNFDKGAIIPINFK